MYSAVPLGERRKMRDRLAERGALRGKKDTVKIQAKATKKSKKSLGIRKVSYGSFTLRDCCKPSGIRRMTVRSLLNTVLYWVRAPQDGIRGFQGGGTVWGFVLT